MPSDHGLYYVSDAPLLAADPACHGHGNAAAGATTLPGLPAAANFQPGQACVVRAGKARQSVCKGTDTGWGTSNPAVSFSVEGTAARFDVGASYAARQEIGHFALPIPQDWSVFDELRLSVKVANVSNFAAWRPGGLVLVVYNSAGQVVSRCGADGNCGINTYWLRVTFPLDQLNPLVDVAAFALVSDVAQGQDGRPHCLAGYDQGGPCRPDGVAFTLWVDDVAVCADLHTTVAVASGSTITLADPLGAAVPEANIPVMTGYGRGVLHDDAPVLQAFLNSVPDFAEVAVPSGLRLPVGSTINLNGRQGLRIAGRTGAGASFPNASFALPSFTWVGRCGQNFWLLDRSRGHVIYGLTWRCDGPQPPRSAVNVDMLPGTGSMISSDMVFERCQVQGPASYGPFCGFELSRVSRQNCEFVRHKDCTVAASKVLPGQGVSYYIGGSFNAKTILYDYCSSGYGVAGWRTDGGSFHARQWTANFNDVDFLVYNLPEPILIEGGNSEYARKAFFLNSNYSVKVSHNRWSSLRDPAGAFQFGTANGCYLIHGNKVHSAYGLAGSPAVIDPASVSYLIDSLGNKFDSFDFLLSNYGRQGGGRCQVRTALDTWAKNGPGF